MDFLLPPQKQEEPVPGTDAMLKLIEGRSGGREKSGLYQKHVEELDWKSPHDK